MGHCHTSIKEGATLSNPRFLEVLSRVNVTGVNFFQFFFVPHPHGTFNKRLQWSGKECFGTFLMTTAMECSVVECKNSITTFVPLHSYECEDVLL